MNLQVGVKVLLTNNKNQILFLLRNNDVEHDAGELWDIPGGRINPTEALFNALNREVQEETNLVLDKNVELIAAQDIFVKKKDLHVVRLTYKGTAAGDVKLSNEHKSFSWMAVEELRRSNGEIDPYILELL